MNLGSMERVQGGFFTALVDENSSGAKFVIPPGLTSINILDYTLTDHINFEANINFPEEDGIVQVETFGCSLNADGTMFYGMQVRKCCAICFLLKILNHIYFRLKPFSIESKTIFLSTT
jgi:hypothetical protein